MAISSKTIANTSLVLRIFVLLVLASSVIVMGTNTISSDGFHRKVNFTDVTTYRYVVAIGIVGFLYTLVQIPFALYHASTEKRWIRNGCLPIFDFYSDKVISFLLATAAGAGFAVTYESKKTIHRVVGFHDTRKFLNIGYVSIGLLFLGFICMAFLSILSANSKKLASRGGFFS